MDALNLQFYSDKEDRDINALLKLLLSVSFQAHCASFIIRLRMCISVVHILTRRNRKRVNLT